MNHFELCPIDDADKETFRQLFNLYHHDLAILDSSLFPVLGEDGFYDHDAIEEYFQETIRDSLILYLIRDEKGPAGFAVLSTPPYAREGCDYCIQEFFIAGNRRKTGLGTRVCRELFARHPGRYCLLVIPENTGAKAYWTRLAQSAGRDLAMEPHEKGDFFAFTV